MLVTPQIFKAVGAGNDSLLYSGFFGVVKVVACGFFVLFIADRIGRRWSLFGGAFLMGSYMLIIAVLTATHPPKEGQGFTSTGAASIAMVYLEASKSEPSLIILVRIADSAFLVSYNVSWGPVPWVNNTTLGSASFCSIC